MSTFLQLVRDVARECRFSGSGGPSTVLNQTGQMNRAVNWVKNAWIELQNEQPNWRWMRSEFSISTVADTDAYAYSDATDSIDSATIERFARWWTDDFQIYLTSAGIGTRHSIPYLDFRQWRQIYLTGNQTSQYPAIISIDPRNKIRLGPPPNDIYAVTGEYQKSAQVLAADADVPEMPTQFHQLIVARALMRYAGNSAAPEVYATAQDVENLLLPSLIADQLPEPQFSGPLC